MALNEIKKASGNSGLENVNVFPEIFEAFTSSDTTSIEDKLMVYVRPTNQLAYNNLYDEPAAVGAILCEIGSFYSSNESRNIEKGTRVLVIKPHPSADNGYILTILGKAIQVNTASKDLVSPGSFSFKGEKAGFHVDGKRNLISLYTGNNNEINLNDSEGFITIGKSQMKLNSNAFKVDNKLSSIDMQKNISFLAGGEITLGAGFYSIENSKKNINLLGGGLIVDVAGGTIKTTSKNTVTTQLVKHEEIGAKYSINIGTNLVNPAISTDKASYELNIINGDMNFSSTVGAINIHSSDLLKKDSIVLLSGLGVTSPLGRTGIPPYSSITMNSLKGIDMKVLGVGVHSFMINPLGLTLSTTGLGLMTIGTAFSLTAGAAIDLKAGAAFSGISAGAMTFTSGALLSLTAAASMTMTAATMIITSPLIVVNGGVRPAIAAGDTMYLLGVVPLGNVQPGPPIFGPPIIIPGRPMLL